MLHVRVKGRSYDLSERMLGLTAGMGDREILDRLERHLDLAAGALTDHVVDRTADGHLIVRPMAVYG